MRFLVTSRIIKAEVGLISQRLTLIALAETLIMLDITKTEPNNCFYVHQTKTKMKPMFLFLH